METWVYDLLISIGGATPYIILAIYLLNQWRAVDKKYCEERIEVLKQSVEVGKDRAELAERQTVTALGPALDEMRKQLENAYAESAKMREQLAASKGPTIIQLDSIMTSLSQAASARDFIQRRIVGFPPKVTISSSVVANNLDEPPSPLRSVAAQDEDTSRG